MKNILKKISIFFVTFLFLSPVFITNVFAASASVSLSGGGTVNTSQSISISVSVSASEAYNATTVNVSFNNLTYVGVSANSQWTGVEGPTRNGNNITFSGAKLGGSFTGSKNVLTINFKAPSSAGSSSVSASGTVALADGSGTQVSAGSKSVSYTVVTPPPPAPTAPGGINVSSSTHPDSNSWYSSKSVTLSWKISSDVTGYSYILDQSDSTTPDNTSEGTDLTKTLDSLKDGVNYFHIKAQNSVGWGSVTHFKIQVDSTQPDPFTITKVLDEVSSSYVIYFATNDDISGISKYTVNIDGVDKGEQKSKYTLPLNAQNVIVTAIDKAGNIKESTIQLSQNSSKSSTALVAEDSSLYQGTSDIIMRIVQFFGPIVI
ncbi:MAG: fibronectin type III domain-containing protein, partial [bacterium]